MLYDVTLVNRYLINQDWQLNAFMVSRACKSDV